MTKDDVKILVNREMESGSTLSRAVHRVHDELSSKEPLKLACAKGCGFCCHQVAPSSLIEWNDIEKYIDDNNMREMIAERGKETIDEWKQYLADNWPEIMKDNQKPFKDWLGKKPCIFLNSESSCDIHEVRPMSCRVVNSTVKCVSMNQPEAARFRFEYERPLMEVIWESGPSSTLIDLFSNSSKR